jgi:hypothetical protein
MIIWYLLLPTVLFGMVALWRRRPLPIALVVLVSLAIALTYGTIVSNAGSLLRYRAADIVLLAVPIAVGTWLVLGRIGRMFERTRL